MLDEIYLRLEWELESNIRL